MRHLYFISNEYPSDSLSLIKSPARMVEVLLNNDENIILDEYKNCIIFL